METVPTAAWGGGPHVGLEEHRWRRRAWQVSHTRTGFGEAGRGSSLSEQLLQKISPQFLQWCCRQRTLSQKHWTEILLLRVGIANIYISCQVNQIFSLVYALSTYCFSCWTHISIYIRSFFNSIIDPSVIEFPLDTADKSHSQYVCTGDLWPPKSYRLILSLSESFWKLGVPERSDSVNISIYGLKTVDRGLSNKHRPSDYIQHISCDRGGFSMQK